MTDPDNIPGGYGRIETEPIFICLFVLFFICFIISVFYNIYLKYKIDCLESNIDKLENNTNDNDKQE